MSLLAKLSNVVSYTVPSAQAIKFPSLSYIFPCSSIMFPESATVVSVGVPSTTVVPEVSMYGIPVSGFDISL